MTHPPHLTVLGTPPPGPPATPLRLGIVEDDPAIRQLLQQYLCQRTEFECLFTVESAEAMWVELDLSLPPQLLLLDLNLPGASGLDVLPELTRRLPATRVLVQTMHDDPATIQRALRAGADGYVLKGSTPLVAYAQALLDVARGEAAVSPAVARHLLAQVVPVPSHEPALLSEREQQVLLGLLDGLTEKQVAHHLGLSLPTVHTHVGKIYRKLQVNSRAELLARAVRGQL